MLPSGRTEEARRLAATNDIRALASAICIYHLDHKRYPQRIDDLVGGYIAKLPKDPWREPYAYEHPVLWSNGGSGDLISLAIDCAPLAHPQPTVGEAEVSQDKPAWKQYSTKGTHHVEDALGEPSMVKGPRLTMSAVEREAIWHAGFSKHPGTSYKSVPDPHAMYSGNKAAADSGDPIAAYKVWKSLHSCSYLATADDIARSRAEAVIADEFIDYAEFNLSHCEALIAEVPHEEVSVQRERYLERAIQKGGHPTAGLYLLEFDDVTYDEVRPLLEVALRSPDSYTYLKLAEFHSRADGEFSYVTHSAWYLVSCKVNPLCDPQEMIGVLQHEFSLLEVDQIARDANHYEQMIAAKDFSFLAPNK